MNLRNRTRSVWTLAGVAMVCLALSAASANAAIIQTTLNNGTSQSFFDGNISNADLINVGSPTLGSFVSSSVGAFPESGTHNGDGVNTSGLSYWTNGGPILLTYTLTGSATGYDITSINSIYGWQDSRSRHAAQRYTVSVTTVSNPTFSPLHTVLYDPWTDNLVGSTQVSLTDSTGVLATGVTAIRFTATTDNGSEVGVIREYDVFGSATAVIPEPTTIAVWSLLGLCWAGMGVWRRRGRRGVELDAVRGRQGWTEENRTAIRQMLDRQLAE